MCKPAGSTAILLENYYKKNESREIANEGDVQKWWRPEWRASTVSVRRDGGRSGAL